jgi:hypothetical protein
MAIDDALELSIMLRIASLAKGRQKALVSPTPGT